MRERVELYAPNHAGLDYAALLEACQRRALILWNQRIAPELNIPAQRAFERALANVGMRAGLSIPWVFASGYAFGAGCHAAAGGNPDNREDAAVACGLYMFILGTFDHLLDEYPQEFSGIGEIINADALKHYVLDRSLQKLKHDDPDKVLMNGLLALYQVYFRLCHRMLDRHSDPALAQTWLDALCELHRVEAESVDRRISKVLPNRELIKHAEAPSIAAFRGLGVTACLAEGEATARRIENFAKDYGQLTWYADDVSDIEKDIKDDIWSGLAIRLVMEAKDSNDIQRVVLKAADEAGGVVTTLYEKLNQAYWNPQDSFSLADVLWAYIWAWLGGQPHQPMDRAAIQRSIQAETRPHT
jgi:hypothetical protein